MRFFRFVTIALLVVACVVLGAACAGGKEEQDEGGTNGVGIEDIVNNGDGTFTVNLTNGESYTTDDLTGPQGDKGDPGPSMILAMGNIDSGGNIQEGYNVTSARWDNSAERYEITLTGIDYDHNEYVTVVNPCGLTSRSASYSSTTDGLLLVRINDQTGSNTQSTFSFVVLECP